uniref:Uncharacterized protein DKFZp686D0114 n=1 Tax=Homo sapiens TaxID=9606 RepID=Q5JPJ9_HUMAN|nr:hypothetical protein [Homo sapiens]
MDPARKAGAQAMIWTAGWLLLLLLRGGAQALECYSCVQKADDGCSPNKMKTVKCAPGVDVCTEAVGAVETIHGQFSLAVRGCGSGLPGKNDRGLDLHGLLAFIQLQQCAQDRCNAKLNLTSRALDPAGAANVTVSLPVRGCVQDEFCTRDGVTGPGFTLSGSCCQGSRCNSDLRNKTYFSPRIPPLVRLPPPEPTTVASTTSVTTSTSAPVRPTSTTKPMPAPTSQTPRQGVEHEASRDEEPRLTGGAAGHQDRSNSGQYPAKGGPQQPHNKGCVAPTAGLAALLLAVAAGVLL